MTGRKANSDESLGEECERICKRFKVARTCGNGSLFASASVNGHVRTG